MLQIKEWNIHQFLEKGGMINDNVTCNNFFSVACEEHDLTTLNVIYDIHPDYDSIFFETASYEENTTATLICEEGFISVGYITTATCTSSGTWSDILSPDACYPGNGTKLFIIFLLTNNNNNVFSHPQVGCVSLLSEGLPIYGWLKIYYQLITFLVDNSDICQPHDLQ